MTYATTLNPKPKTLNPKLHILTRMVGGWLGVRPQKTDDENHKHLTTCLQTVMLIMRLAAFRMLNAHYSFIKLLMLILRSDV